MGCKALTSTSLGIGSQNVKTSKVFKSGKNLKNRSFEIVKNFKIFKNLSFLSPHPGDEGSAHTSRHNLRAIAEKVDPTHMSIVINEHDIVAMT